MARYIWLLITCVVAGTNAESAEDAHELPDQSFDEVLRSVRQTTLYSDFDPKNFLRGQNVNGNGGHSSPGSNTLNSGSFEAQRSANQGAISSNSFLQTQFSTDVNQFYGSPENSFTNQIFNNNLNNAGTKNKFKANNQNRKATNILRQSNYNSNNNHNDNNVNHVFSSHSDSEESSLSQNQFTNINENTRNTERPFVQNLQSGQQSVSGRFGGVPGNNVIFYVQDDNKNFISNLASVEDIHTDTDDNNFGISLLSNDGINQNVGNPHIVTPVVDNLSASPKETILKDNKKNGRNDNSFESFENIGQSFGGLQISSSHDISNKQQTANSDSSLSSAGSVNTNSGNSQLITTPFFDTQPQFRIKDNSQEKDDSFETFVTLRSLEQNFQNQNNLDQSFSSQGNGENKLTNQLKGNKNFGIQLPASITAASSSTRGFQKPISDTSIPSKATTTTIQEGELKSFDKGVTSPSIAGDSSLPILRPKPVEVLSSDSLLEPLNDNIQIESVINTVNSLSKSEASQVQDLLGGMTLGELLMGINGKNGIMVLPMSDANKAKAQSSQSNSIQFLGDDSKEIFVREATTTPTTTTTTTSAPRTRRPSRRRTTTRPPDHIRRSLSDLLYSKGQWFGTLVGGLIDYGRIVKDAFNNNIGTSSRGSYA